MAATLTPEDWIYMGVREATDGTRIYTWRGLSDGEGYSFNKPPRGGIVGCVYTVGVDRTNDTVSAATRNPRFVRQWENDEERISAVVASRTCDTQLTARAMAVKSRLEDFDNMTLAQASDELRRLPILARRALLANILSRLEVR